MSGSHADDAEVDGGLESSQPLLRHSANQRGTGSAVSTVGPLSVTQAFKGSRTAQTGGLPSVVDADDVVEDGGRAAYAYADDEPNDGDGDGAAEDSTDLTQFGYKQQLKRTLTLFSTIGLAFSYISPVVGVYSLFGQGLSSGGPAYIWSAILVLLGQWLVMLVFCELAVAFPLAGALYQWGRHLVSPRFGWLVGWMYGWALTITIAAINVQAAPYVFTVLGHSVDYQPTTSEQVLVGLVLLGIHTMFNLGGMRVTGLLTNIGLVTEVGMTVVLGIALLASKGPRQNIDIITKGPEGGSFQFGGWLAGSLSQAFVFYGFESAADVSEEVMSAKKSVPRAMKSSLFGAALVAIFLELCLLVSIPDIAKASANNGAEAIPQILDAHIGYTATRVLFGFLLVAYLSCAGAVQAACARILFSYARDDAIIGSSHWKVITPGTQVPTRATILVAVLAACIVCSNYIKFSDTVNMNTVIVNYGVAGIYTAFQLVVAGRLYFALVRRESLHPPQVDETEFTWKDQGNWWERNRSVVYAAGALVYGVSMIINILWPRPTDVITSWLTLISWSILLIVGIICASFVGDDAPAKRWLCPRRS